jgi:hypothetical protein
MDTGRATGLRIYGVYLLSLGVCLLGNLLIRLGTRGGWFSPGAQGVLAVVSALPLVAVAGWFWGLRRRGLDELMQRVALEGMAFTFVVFVPISGFLVNLRTAGVGRPHFDPTDLLLAPAVLLAAGLALAWRRYQ